MWYAVDIRNLRFGELWRISPGAGFLVAAASKLLRFPVAVDTRVCLLSSVDLLDAASLDPEVRDGLAPLVGAWRGEGFGAPLYYTVPMKGSGQRAAAAAQLSADRLVLAQSLFVEKRTALDAQRVVQAHCLSVMGDGTYLGATGLRRRMDSPPQFQGEHLPGQPPAALHTALRRRLEDPRNAPRALRDEDVPRTVLELHNLSVRFNIDRGVYVPATD